MEGKTTLLDLLSKLPDEGETSKKSPPADWRLFVVTRLEER